MAEDFLNMDEFEIPPFDVGAETGVAFPAGTYLAVLGRIIPVFPKDSTPGLGGVEPEAVQNEIWLLKYLGTSTERADDVRVSLADGKVKMAHRGSKMVERYPNPSFNPKMKWKAAAFFSEFGCIDEIPSASDGIPPNRVVNWKKVKALYGTVFRFTLGYNSSSTGKSYRNIDYRTIEVTENRIKYDDLKKIEAHYDAMRAAEKAEESGEPPVLTEADLPF